MRRDCSERFQIGSFVRELEGLCPVCSLSGILDLLPLVDLPLKALVVGYGLDELRDSLAKSLGDDAARNFLILDGVVEQRRDDFRRRLRC